MALNNENMNLEKLTKEILSQSYNITTEAGEQLVVIESGDVLDILKRLASDGDLADVRNVGGKNFSHKSL